jgi:hypothetical protein
VAMDAHGRFVVVWRETAEGSQQIRARQYPSPPSSAEGFVVSQQPPLPTAAPQVAIDASGDFVVVWDGGETDQGVARLYAQTGTPLLDEIGGFGTSPRVAMDADGDFYVAAAISPYLFVQRVVGPEPIDISLTAQAPDRALPDTPVDVVYTLTNNHPGRVETGIPAVDAAIGIASHSELTISYSGGDAIAVPDGCELGELIECRIDRIPAGSTWRGSVGLNGPPGAILTSAFVQTRQADDVGNNSVERTILIECAPGTGGTIEFSVLESTIAEGGSSAAVALNRVGGACGDLSVRAEVGGMVTAGDYRTYPQDALASWGHKDEQARTIYVFGRVDWLDELNEREAAEISLALVSGAGAVDGRKAIVWITDGEGEPEVEAGASVGALYEGQVGRFHAQLTWRTERPVTVAFTLSGRASPGEDFIAPSEGQLVIEPGTLFNTVPIQTLTDEVAEGQESLIFTMETASNARIENVASWSMAIFDSDPSPLVNIISADETIVEGEATFVVVALSQPSPNQIAVPLTVVSGQAHVTLSQTVLQFPPGTMQRNVLVQAIQNGVADGVRSAVIRLGSSSPARLGDDVEFKLTINDDDVPPVISFDTPAQSMWEDAGQALLRLSLSHASLSHASSQPVEFSLTHEPETSLDAATYGSDYSYSTGRFVIPAGQTILWISLPLLDDKLPELDEKAVIRLTNVVNAEDVSATHTLTIKDDETEAIGIIKAP